MKYIKLFEQHSINDFIREKINWKLFDYIKDLLQEYSDKGSPFSVIVYITNVNSKYAIYRYGITNNGEYDPNFEGIANIRKEEIEYAMQQKSITIFYEVSIMRVSEDNGRLYPLNKKVMQNLIDKIVNKFNIPITRDDKYYFTIKEKLN